MIAKQRALIASVASIGAITSAIVVYGIVTLRLCREQSHVQRGSRVFHLCGLDDEMISSVPVEKALDEPMYSWRNTDGTKPTVRRVEYTSGRPTGEVRGELVSFLRSKRYAPQEPIPAADVRFEWWTDGQILFGFDLTDDGPTKTHVAVVLNAGLN